MLCRRGLQGCLCHKEEKAELQVKLGGIRVERKNESQGERKSYYLGGEKKKKNQIRAWTAWICFSLSRLYKCTKHSGRFFSRMLLVQIQVLKFQAFHLLHARTQNSAQSLHSQNSQQARAKLQNYSQVRYFKGEKKKNPDSRPSTGSADCWLGCEPPWCKRGIFSVAFSRREKHQGTAQRRGAPASSRCCNLGSVPKGREVETEWNYWNVCDSH